MLLHSLLLAWAPPPTPNATLIQQYLASAHIPSVSLAVVTGNGSAIPYTAAFGAADLNTGRKSTTDTLYMLASISKTITAWTAMQAVERGALKLDDDINSVLPPAEAVTNLGGGNGTITLRHLLTHTSCVGQTLVVDDLEVEPGDEKFALGKWLASFLSRRCERQL